MRPVGQPLPTSEPTPDLRAPGTNYTVCGPRRPRECPLEVCCRDSGFFCEGQTPKHHESRTSKGDAGRAPCFPTSWGPELSGSCENAP